MFVLLSFLVVASFAKAPCPDDATDANTCGAARVDNDPKKPYLNCIFDDKIPDVAEKCYQLTVGKLDLKALNDEKLSWSKRITGARRTIDYQDVIQMPDGTAERIAFSNDGAVTVNLDAEGKVQYAKIEEDDGKVYMFQKEGEGFIETSEDRPLLSEHNDVLHEEESLSDHLKEIGVSAAIQATDCDGASNVQKPPNGKNWILRTQNYYTEEALKKWVGKPREEQFTRLKLLIAEQVSKANQIFANSKIPLRVVVESLKFLPYKGDDFPQTFDKLRTLATPQERKEARDQYREQTLHIVDPGPKRVVVIWCNTNHVGRYAWVLGMLPDERTFISTPTKANGVAFHSNRLRRMWMGTKLATGTFGHEIGHLFGLSHNYKGLGMESLMCPGCGIMLKCDDIRTVMSYSYTSSILTHPLLPEAFAVPPTTQCQGSQVGRRIPFYSSRTIKYTTWTGNQYVLGNDNVHSDECVMVALSGMGPGDIDPCNDLPATEASCTYKNGHICKVILHEIWTLNTPSSSPRAIKTTTSGCKAVGIDKKTYISLYEDPSPYPRGGYLQPLCKDGKRHVTMTSGTTAEHLIDHETCEEVSDANTASKKLKCSTTAGKEITFSASTTKRIGAKLKGACHHDIAHNIKNVEEQIAASSSSVLNLHGLLLLFAFSGLIFYVGFHFGWQKEDHVYEQLLDEI